MLDSTKSTTVPPASFGHKNLAGANTHVNKLLQRAEAAHKAGKKKLFRNLARKCLQSHDAKMLATHKAYRALKWNRRPNHKKLPLIAETLNPWCGSKEKVLVQIKLKDNGDHRLLLNFGIENRALQYLLVPILQAAAELHPLQYALQGGVPAAIDKLTELLRDGYVWTVETDIANCFPSFDGKNLHKWLPIPKEVIRKVIMADTLNVSPGDNVLYHFGPADDDPGNPVALAQCLADARRGIPQGSAVASLVAEMLIAPVLKSLPSEARVPSYADNMLTMARNEKDAVSITKALWSDLQSHPVGQLRPKIRNESGPGEPVTFLGHRLQLVGKKVLITPTPENRQNFMRKIKRGLKSMDNPSEDVRRRRARELKSYISSWTANFSRCPEIANYKETLFDTVNHALKQNWDVPN